MTLNDIFLQISTLFTIIKKTCAYVNDLLTDNKAPAEVFALKIKLPSLSRHLLLKKIEKTISDKYLVAKFVTPIIEKNIYLEYVVNMILLPMPRTLLLSESLM